MTQPSGAPAWRVTGQQATSRASDDGQLQDGVTVFFTTGNGQRSSVFVPNSLYQPDNVRAAIATRAALVDQVAGMTSEDS